MSPENIAAWKVAAERAIRLRPGETVEYFLGGNIGSEAAKNRDVMVIMFLAQEAYDTGAVSLFQRRISENLYQYLAKGNPYPRKPVERSDTFAYARKRPRSALVTASHVTA